MNPKTVISVLGSSGGVAKAILSIFNRSIQDHNDPINSFLQDCQIHLIDLKQKDMLYYQHSFPALRERFSLHEFDLNDTAIFKKHLIDTNRY